MKTVLAALAACLFAAAAGAQNEADWKPYFSYSGITFYYAPSSLSRDGDTRTLKWHDTANPQVVFRARIDCAAHTMQSLSADQYDLLTGTYYGTEDLSGQPADELGGPASMGGALAKAVC
jgi:hypothetical protein